ncbi:hypothetical protein PC128_g13729 [Phytophthora cactorum]|nr:hypothetical protein PC128_g13729 [Phytophthora cactorum]
MLHICLQAATRQDGPILSDSDTSGSKRTLAILDYDDSLDSKRICKSITVDPAIHNAFDSQDPSSPDEVRSFLLSQQPLTSRTLTHEEIVLKAAEVCKNQCDLTNAMVFAATNDHFHVVMKLLHQLKLPKIGHRDIVMTLLNWMEVDGEIDRNTTWAVRDEAATYRPLEVVKLMARYLLRYPWNLAFYFMEAMEKEQHADTKKIYLIFPLYFDGKNLFVEMAGDGFTCATMYMYTRGYCSEELIQDAFVKAAVARRTEILEFLLATGRVSMEGFERGLEAAATSGSIAAVTYLDNKKLSSLQGIHRAFEVSGSLAVTKFLYKTEKIPAQSMTAALKNVTGIGTMIQMHKKDREAIALFLCKEGCIPAEMICTVFAMTVYDLAGMVESLYGNLCISRQVVCAALQQAADSGHVNIVRYLMDKQQGQTVYTLRRRRTFRASACDREVSATAETIQLSPQPHQEQSLATGMLMTTPLRASVAQSASRSPQNSKDNKVTVAREQYALRQQQRFGVFGGVAAGLAVDDGAGSAREPGLCEGRGGRAGPLVVWVRLAS